MIILVSVLASRKKWIWSDLICRQQSGSVPGRNIFSALTLNRDMFEYTNLIHNTGLFLSLDQKSVFDEVSHSYTYAVLESYGFPADFTALLRALYDGLSRDVLINWLIQGRVQREG